MKVRLTIPERIQAAAVGMQRQLQNLRDGNKQRYGAPEDGGWQRHIEACMAEMAVAKARNVFWSGTPGDRDNMLDQRHEGDVGKVEVRQTPYSPGFLRIHPDDKKERYYVLAVGINGTYDIRGAKLCVECQQQKYWGDRWGKKRPAYWVHEQELEPFDPRAPYEPLTPEELQAYVYE